MHPDRPAPPGALTFDALSGRSAAPHYEQVPFDHPLWILYSSGTTGLPKGIVQSQGGILIEHLKLHGLHFDTGPDDRVFILASTAWMVWNALVSALSVGATIITYDGSPVKPETDAMFAVCARHRVTWFGTGAAYLTICERAGAHPAAHYDLSALPSIMSTGSPLPVAASRCVSAVVRRLRRRTPPPADVISLSHKEKLMSYTLRSGVVSDPVMSRVGTQMPARRSGSVHELR